MSISCKLATGFPFEDVSSLFATELERQHARSKVFLRKEDGGAVFEIKAQDIAAMRAAFSGITSILSVYAKTGELHGR